MQVFAGDMEGAPVIHNPSHDRESRLATMRRETRPQSSQALGLQGLKFSPPPRRDFNDTNLSKG